MRVLVLMPKLCWPLTGGAEIRNFNLLRETAKQHEVHLLSFLNQSSDRDHFPSLMPYCKQVVGVDLSRPTWKKAFNAMRGVFSPTPFILHEYRQRQMASTLEQMVEQEKIDIVHAHFLHVGQYYAATGRAALVYDAHNLEHVLWQRFAGIQSNPLKATFARWQCGKLVAAQRAVAAHSEKVVVLSDSDHAEYLRIAPTADVTTVPNGADVEYFQPRNGASEPNSITYFGNFGWPPQDDGAIYFHDEILPRVRARVPDAKLYLVGKTPSEPIRRLASENVVVTGFVPDIRDYIARSAVVVMPLRVGAGTKHRIFQSLAMRKALVSTTVGAEGIALKHGENAMIADDPQQFADCTVRLLQDAKLRERLGENGRQLVLKHHDWRAIYRTLDDVFHEAVDKKRRA